MRKRLKLPAFVFILLMLILAVNSVTVSAAVGLTDSDIKEGLDFCRDYPVSLTLDGQKVQIDPSGVPAVIIKERTLIPARALFEKMGGVVTWDEQKQAVGITLNKTQVSLTINSQTAYVNGQAKTLDVPALIIDHDGDYYGSTMIPVRFVAESIGCTISWDDATRTVGVKAPAVEPSDEAKDDKDADDNTADNENSGDETVPHVITRPEPDPSIDLTDDNDNTGTSVGSGTLSGNGVFTAMELSPLPMLTENAKKQMIVIDAGHGGKDCGSIGNKGTSNECFEKTPNLDAALKLNAWLKASGATTYMTRSGDVYYTLLERAQKANTRAATLFVSCHNNSNTSSSPNGTEVHYYSKVNEYGDTEKDIYGIESKAVAKLAEKYLVDALQTNERGIKESPKLAVLNKTQMPAIIVEGAFMSNPSDLSKIQSSEYAERYAYAVAKAIIESFNKAFPG
ncbi:MAG: N-acetylmuramoyl-L-alanine amidase [Clostridia bacterium]|nr:N-acetylmuramoyl-L-alanine amidase [Clostridia bacterium]